MFKNVIGKKSEKIKNIIERGAVKKFAESIGDPHPIYIDEEYGRQSRYGINIAPPTFPRTLDFGEIKELYLPNIGLIHGEQTYHYERPLFVGEEINCYTEVADYYEKESKMGYLGFVLLKTYGEDLEGNTIFTEDSTIIITEAVRKELVK